ncbi:MAG: DinB family protein [Anaerolineae bacterium]|nr:DinB family protein [Anaerolineae bacterium]
MSTKPRQDLHVAPLDGYAPSIGRALWMLEDTRNDTGRILDGIAPEVIDWQPPNGNSIGTLLYHIALIEMDWLFNEVMEAKMSATVWDAFPFSVRGADDRLTVVTGVSLDAHFKRLDSTRRLVLDTFKDMTLDEFHRPRPLELYDVTPEWVIHHLVLHETEHRGEIGTIRTLAEVTLK